MALYPIPYANLETLVGEYLSNDESEATAELINQLRAARKRGWLRRSELEAVCYWKSPRTIHHIRANTPAKIRAATSAAIATRSERLRFEQLTQLKGVSAPMASAILMLLYPKRYGVIDIRVWQVLIDVGTVTKNPRGVGFGFNNWYQYLMTIRHLAKRFDVKARDIERTLFLVHKVYQKGVLYELGS
jgi:hypothetical protein